MQARRDPESYFQKWLKGGQDWEVVDVEETKETKDVANAEVMWEYKYAQDMDMAPQIGAEYRAVAIAAGIDAGWYIANDLMPDSEELFRFKVPTRHAMQQHRSQSSCSTLSASPKAMQLRQKTS